MIKSMDLAWIIVSDFERAKKFYTETLGLKVRSCSPEYSWMELVAQDSPATAGLPRHSLATAGAALGVGADCGSEKNPVRAGSNGIMTMSVDDIIATKADLESKGVQFLAQNRILKYTILKFLVI